MPSRSDNPTINPDAIKLEERFFAEQNARLLEKLREEAKDKERRNALREALHVEDEKILDALIELDLYPETAVAFGLVPLIEVAWADFEVQRKEREAILEAAEARGIEAGTTTHELLESWLDRKPDADLLETWKSYVKVLVAGMDATQRQTFRDGVLAQAKDVARQAGGILGLGQKISKDEEKMIRELEAAFG